MQLPIVTLRFHLEAQDPIHLPGYPGSALRGIFGHGLRRTACVTRQSECEGCTLLHHCAYAYLFETPLPPGTQISRMNGNKAPHPIIFNFSPTNNHNQPGEHLTFELTLIDQSARYLPYLIQAWQYAGERGVGKENARFHLAAIDAPPFAGSDQWQPLYTRATQQIAGLNPQPTQPPPYTSNPIDITFTSPFRTKVRGKLIGPGEFSPTHWIRPLLNRIEHLRLIHSPQTSSSLDVAALITATHNLRITRKQLRWHDWTRHSSRQRSQMQMGGLVGGFTLVGEPLETLWPLLWLGQWLHAGKGTSFGLGGYRLAEQTGQQ